MSISTVTGTGPRRQIVRSVGAILGAFLFVVVISLVTDEILHLLHFYPPWGEPMYDTTQNFVALAYRLVIGVAGGYVTARLAPYAPMGHVWAGAVLGLVVSTAGAIATIRMGGFGPAWYPIALAVSAVPCSLIGGWLYLRGARVIAPSV